MAANATAANGPFNFALAELAVEAHLTPAPDTLIVDAPVSSAELVSQESNGPVTVVVPPAELDFAPSALAAVQPIAPQLLRPSDHVVDLKTTVDAHAVNSPALPRADREPHSEVDNAVIILNSQPTFIRPQPWLDQALPAELRSLLGELSLAGLLMAIGWLVWQIVWPIRVAIRKMASLFEQLGDLASSLSHYLRHPPQMSGEPVADEPEAIGTLKNFRLWERLAWQPAFAFALTAVLLVAPLRLLDTWALLSQARGQVLGVSEQAYGNLRQGLAEVTNLRFDEAQTSFNDAAARFDQARLDLERSADLLDDLARRLPMAQQRLSDGQRLLDAAALLSRSASGFSAALAQVQSSDLTVAGRTLQTALTQVNLDLGQAQAELESVDATSLPGVYQQRFNDWRTALPNWRNSLEHLASWLVDGLSLIGADQPRRYLLLLQNDSELRPTGGFIGTIAVVTVAQGRIQQLQIPGGGPYDLKGSFPLVVAAPQPLQLIAPRWYLWDANWWADFPTSARKLLWFFQRSGGPTVDGLISVNANILPSLLTLTGPIAMPEYGKVIDQQNFYQETQLAVELLYDRKLNRPKQFLADLAPRLLERLGQLPVDRQTALFDLLLNSLQSRDLQAFLVDERLQQALASFGWDGALQPSEGDALAPIHTNIAGGKSDRVISTSYRLTVELLPDGRIRHRLEVVRQHRGQAGEAFTGLNNVDYLRLYVPAGSTLLEVDGLRPPPAELFKAVPEGASADPDVSEVERTQQPFGAQGATVGSDSGFTVFAGWQQTKPGQVSVSTWTYETPGRWSNAQFGRYLLRLRRQSGHGQADWQIALRYPDGYLPRWTSQAPSANASHHLRWDLPFDGDQSVGLLLQAVR